MHMVKLFAHVEYQVIYFGKNKDFYATSGPNDTVSFAVCTPYLWDYSE
jgi:hypothetical protein